MAKYNEPTPTQRSFMYEMLAGTLKKKGSSYMFFESYKPATRIRCFRKGWIAYDDNARKFVVTAAGRAALRGGVDGV